MPAARRANKRTVVVLVGTRPEVVKMAPVLRALRGAGLRAPLIGTGQHRHMLAQMLDDFQMTLDADLDIMRPGQEPADVLRGVLRALPAVLRRLRPDLILVQGDTTSALAATLCARRQGLPVGHVEAGLRSHDVTRPYPEELNRVLIDRLSDLHFAPTTLNRRNLIGEGIPAAGIFVTGNTGIDSLSRLLKHGLPAPRSELADFLASARGFRKALLTIHRRENLGAPMARVFQAVRLLLEEHPRLKMLYPAHMNPSVQRAVLRLSIPRLTLCSPLAYADSIRAIISSDLILSDSGGLQEEACALGVPMLVLREVTDRPETLKTGFARLAGTKTKDILRHARAALRLGRGEGARGRLLKVNPYGRGDAAEKITAAALSFLRSHARGAENGR